MRLKQIIRDARYSVQDKINAISVGAPELTLMGRQPPKNIVGHVAIRMPNADAQSVEV